MIGLAELIPVVITYLSRSKAVDQLQDAAEEAIRARVGETYKRLKGRLIEKLQGKVEIEPVLDRMEAEPESEETKQVLTEQAEKAAPHLDTDTNALIRQLEELIRQTPAGNQLTIRQNVTGEKNIIVGHGDINVDNINFG